MNMATKRQLLYIHGGSAFNIYDNYIEYLRTKDLDPYAEKPQRWTTPFLGGLKHAGWEVFAPSMPNSGNAKYLEWKIWFERHLPYLRDGVVLVGWSQGGYFLAKYLCEHIFPRKIGALFLVAAPIQSVCFDAHALEDGGDFGFDIAHLPHLEQQVAEIHVLHSKDDFVVPYTHAEKYVAMLKSATMHTFEDKNHFLIEAFPEMEHIVRSV